MTRNKIIIIVIAALLLGCLMVFVKPLIAKYTFSEKDFAVKETEKITKIILTNTNGEKSELTKENDVWMINHQYKAREKAVQSLLHVIKNIQADYPVSKSGHNNVMKMMLGFNTKVEIFTTEKKAIKTYYVGPTTVTGDGTFMILEHKGKMTQKPYVTKILGMNGSLIPYYIADPKPWRSREIFAYPASNIKKIAITYPQTLEASFVIDNSGSKPTISSSFNKFIPIVGLTADSAKLYEYIHYYEVTYAENYINEYDQIDTIKNTSPYCIMQITDKNNKVNNITIYNLPTTERSKTQLDPMGNKIQYDTDKFVALINDGKDYALIQYYVFGKYFKRYEQFFNIPFEQLAGKK